MKQKHGWKKIMALLLGLLLAVCSVTVHTTEAASVTFIWPTQGVTALYRGFGNGHYGLDIAADAGTPVIAAASGTVQCVYTGCNNYDGYASGGKTCKELGICNPSKSYYKDGFCNSAYGNAVIIKHDDGTWTAYAHLQSVSSGITVGTRVSQGQQIGISGSTGRSSGAHLHFEMRTGDGSGEEFWLATAFDPLERVSTSSAYLNDTTAPVISDVQVYDVTENGYWVSCTVTDDDSGVAYVVFPTWTTRNGQDDLAVNWNSASSSAAGTINGSQVTFYVSKKSHRWEAGTYVTHIYAYDANGNYTTAGAPSVEVPAYGYADDTGDVDASGEVEAKDALLVLQAVVELSALNEEETSRADINQNGTADTADALYILQKVVDLIVFE